MPLGKAAGLQRLGVVLGLGRPAGWGDVALVPWYGFPMASSEPPGRIASLTFTRYRSFREAERLDLAPITVLLGKNNVGKSSLLRLPLFATLPFAPAGPATPFPLDDARLGPPHGASLAEVIHEGDYAGLEVGLSLADGRAWSLAATVIPERSNAQRLLGLTADGVPTRPSDLAAARSGLASGKLAWLYEGCDFVGHDRELPWRTDVYPGQPPARVGGRGEDTFKAIQAAAGVTGDDAGFARLSQWFRDALDLRLVHEFHAERSEIRVSFAAAGRSPRPPDQCGAGVGQVLPVAVAALCPPPDSPRHLLAIEYPESQLHPAAHADVAEMLLQGLRAFPERQILLETHSDPLTLRLRAMVAEGRLSPSELRFYYVGGPDESARLRQIQLDEEATPLWWPKGVFAEPQAEFVRIRRALQSREHPEDAGGRVG